MPHLNPRRRVRSTLLLAALPVWMATQSSACPFLLFFSQTMTYEENYNACSNCYPVYTREFEDPTNPEDAVAVDFEVTSPDSLEPNDVTVELQLTCGHGVGGNQAFPVTLQSAGLTKLTGRFEGSAKSLCTPSNGQRSPGLWTVFVRRNISGQSVMFRWTVKYREYVG